MQTREALLNETFKRVDGYLPEEGVAKHQKMAIDPFLFFRGSAALFYQDLASTLLKLPENILNWPLTTIIGDCHISNFGLLSEEGSHGDTVIFAPNDFDDACMGHAAWDLMRCLVSIHLAGALDRVRCPADIHEIAQHKFLDAYRKTCKKLAKNKINYNYVLDNFAKQHVLHKAFKKAHSRTCKGAKFNSKSSLAKAVDLTQETLGFRDNPERFKRLSRQQYQAAEKAFAPYVDDNIIDIVQRLGAGTGSVNMQRYYLLVGPTQKSDPDTHHLYHIVEVKKQRQAAPLYYFPDLSPVNQLNPAHLTVMCQYRMQRNADLVLDELLWKKSHWLIRSRHHARVGLAPEDILQTGKAKHLVQYAQACGQALALAHARGDRRSHLFEKMVADTLPDLKADLLQNANQYANQVIADWQWLQTQCYSATRK
ncbi:DUF2252 family protein [Catenovulum sediminis]|uniref:DUF2252 family protein n=2 Tax=Catenovulum sediminis TaxID=1740262 RepID=A0ABV1RCP9_9ALTE